MTAATQATDSIRIARKIRTLEGVRSVRTEGLYVPKFSDELYPLAMTGQTPATLSNNIATYLHQLDQGMPHEGYFSVTVAPDKALQVVDTIQQKAKSVLAYTNVSSAAVELFFVKTTAAPEDVIFSHWDGRHFREDALHGKDGAKRARVRKTLSGLNNGAFMSFDAGRIWTQFDADGNPWECATWPLPNGDELTVAIVPEPHGANDNDGLITEEAAIRLTAATATQFSKKTEFVQMLTLAYNGVAKCAAEILRGEPQHGQAHLVETLPNVDVFIGAEGHNRKVWLENVSMGRVTLWDRKSWEPNWVTADALQTFLRWTSQFEVDMMLGLGSAMLRAQLREDQLHVLTTPMSLLQQEAIDEQYRPEYRPEHETAAWQLVNKAEQEAGAIARRVNGSPFAWADAIDYRASRVARILQGMVNENRSSSYNDQEGMPAWIIPGQYMMLAHHDFAGVKKPRNKWISMAHRHNAPGFYAYSVHPEDFASKMYLQETDHSDSDDKSSLTPATDPNTGNGHLVTLRRPSSPFGGSNRRATKAQLREWHRETGIPVIPLRPDWQERLEIARQYIELPMGISPGPERVPQPATNDVKSELVANIWAAQQITEVGLASLIMGVISLSGLADENSKTIISNMIDNAFEQMHNNEFITSALMDRLLELIHQRKPIFSPALAKIRGVVIEAYKEKYGRAPVIVKGRSPEAEAVWNHLTEENRYAHRAAGALPARANGIPNHMIEELDPAVTSIAFNVVKDAASFWKNWSAEVGENQKSDAAYTEKKAFRAHKSELTNSLIARRVLQGLDEARDTDLYIPGNFARALWQIQLTESRRWRKGKRPYKLVALLDKEELEAFFDSTDFGPTDPTWVSRINMRKDGQLQPGDICVVRKADRNRWTLVRKSDGVVVGVLEPEGYGISGLDSEFLGFVPVAKPGNELHCTTPVAVFRNDAEEIIERTRAELRKQLDQVQSYHTL